jgi:hypothetical protein
MEGLTRAGEERPRGLSGVLRGLSAKFALRLGLLFLAFPVIVSALTYHQTRQAETAALERHGAALASLFNYSLQALHDQGSSPTMQRILANGALISNVRRVRMTDLAGKIIASSYRPEVGTSSTSPLLRSFLDSGSDQPIVQLLDERSELTIIRPIYHGQAWGITAQPMVGATELLMERREVDSLAFAAALRMLASSGCVALAFFMAALLGLRAAAPPPGRRDPAAVPPQRLPGNNVPTRLGDPYA